MANEYSFTDHRHKLVQKGDEVRIFSAPHGKNEWVGVTGVVSSIVLPGGDDLVMLLQLKDTPKGYNDRMVYIPKQHLERTW